MQERAGEVALADRVGGGIGERVPPAAADFLAEREMVVVAARAPGGQVWVTLLTGPEGFADAPDEGTVVVARRSGGGRPPAAGAGAGHPHARSGCSPSTRPPAAACGSTASPPPRPRALTIATTQVFANCPKYIRPRRVVAHRPDDPASAPVAPAARTGAALTAEQRAWVSGADTFFVGTADVDGAADASHRGGAPGFVHVVGDDRLRIPDYRGNSMYMTLGNVERQPAAGLLFVDWEGGSTLQLTGEVTVDHDLAAARALDPRAGACST